MKSWPRQKSLALTAALVPLMILLFFDPVTPKYWMQVIFDWLHVVVFVVTTIGIYYVFGETRLSATRTRVVVVTAVAAAFLTELIQIPMARNASWLDVGSNLTGILIGLLTIPTFANAIVTPARARLLAACLFVVSAYPVAVAAALYAERNRAFPVIADGTWPTHDAFRSVRDTATDFRNLVPDWSGYSYVIVEITAFGDQPVPISVRVHDTRHRRGTQPHNDRFNQSFLATPGDSTFEIALEDIAAAPDTRRMDITDIDALVIFTNTHHATPLFEIREIRLSHEAESMIK